MTYTGTRGWAASANFKVRTLRALRRRVADVRHEDSELYLYGRIETHLREGLAMDKAFTLSTREAGTATVYTGMTLAIGVVMWAFSGLKFQTDMGWLLAFLVLTNALAAITVLPAMAVITDLLVPRRAPAAWTVAPAS